MRRSNPIPALLTAAVLPVVALAQEPAARTYEAEAARSDVYVVIRNDTSASLARLGHDHVIYAKDFDGRITWPTEAGGPCSVSFRIPVDKLIVDPPGLRDKAGLDDNTIDDGQKEKLKQNMWGRSQLDAGDHPYITFEATTCPGGTGTVPVAGKLTIRGVSQDLTVPMSIAISDDGTFKAKGSFKTTHEAHGFKPFRASPFGPRNAETLSFTLDVVALPKG